MNKSEKAKIELAAREYQKSNYYIVDRFLARIDRRELEMLSPRNALADYHGYLKARGLLKLG